MEEEGPGDDLEAPPAPVPIESPSQSSRVAVRPNVFDPFSEDQPMNNKRASMDVVGPTCEYNPESMKRQRICNFPREGASPDPFLSQYPQEVFNQAPIHPTIHHLAAAASSLRDPNSSYLMHPNQQVNYDLFSDEEASAFFENM